MYQIEQKVCHPGHGACIVREICEKEVGGSLREYYLLEPLLSPGTKLFVPVDNAEKLGLRDLISEEHADRLLETLVELKSDWISDQKQRQQKVQALLGDNSIDSLQDSMSAIASIVTHKNEHSLGRVDQGILQSIESKALSEIALAKDIAYDDAVALVEELLSTDTVSVDS